GTSLWIIIAMCFKRVPSTARRTASKLLQRASCGLAGDGRPLVMSPTEFSVASRGSEPGQRRALSPRSSNQSELVANASSRLGHHQPVLVLRGPVGRPGAPGRCRAPHARHGLSRRSSESMEQRLLQRPAGQEHAGLSRPALPGYVADHHLHLPRCVPGLSEPDARNPLATLADRPVPPRLAGRWSLLSDAAPGE